jgi:L,D-peptidoglycan transpeptidase YkuD (ErfK/YbiS/YcfS/YnhG family)
MRNVSLYRRGLLVDCPTDGRCRGGSGIFIHIRHPGAHGTSGCVAVPEPVRRKLGVLANPRLIKRAPARRQPLFNQLMVRSA